VLLAGVGGLAAVGVGVAAVALSDERGSPKASRSDATADLFGRELEDARVLGAAYLLTDPGDPVVSSSRAVPPGSVPPGTDDPGAWFAEVPPSVLAEQSALGCREDFVAERTIELQGWVLPLTALQLCGIAAEET
jgi:hypothetical protein